MARVRVHVRTCVCARQRNGGLSFMHCGPDASTGTFEDATPASLQKDISASIVVHTQYITSNKDKDLAGATRPPAQGKSFFAKPHAPCGC